jgi:alpha-L-fucosidase
MQKWREYGLGQFIHWGVYAIPGGHWNGEVYRGAAEWIRSWRGMPNADYDNLYKQFNPVNFNARQWARQAKAMGAKYLIITTKHHDGFCLWPSKYTDYTVANTPYRKDIIRELVDAYNAEGIDVTLYFSIIDWSHKGWRSSVPKTDEELTAYEEFKQFTRNQLIELLQNYPSVKGLWFDGTWEQAWIAQAPWVDELETELRALRPGLIIGSRFRADEYGKRHYDSNGDLIGDYDQTWERSMPETLAEIKGVDWDCVMTIPENQWGYHSDWSLTYVKKSYELIEMIVKAVSLNGNFVLNFGPDGNGNIRPEETQMAAEIGAWMKVNGEAIYGCKNSAWEKQGWGYYTQRGESKLYLTVFNQPLNNQVRVKVPGSSDNTKVVIVEKAYFLADNKAVIVRNAGRDKNGNIYYDIDTPTPNTRSPYVIVLEIKEVPRDQQDNYQQAII